MDVDVGPQLDLFDVDRLLPLAGDIGFFLIFVFELAKIDDLANWRIGIRRYLDEVEIDAISPLDGLLGANNTNLLTIFIDEPNFRTVDFCVYPRSGAFRRGNVYWSSSDLSISL